MHGRPAYLDGHGDGRIAILTSSGDVVWSLVFDQDHPFSITDAVWEDDAHLLAIVYQEKHWRIVRFGVDGTMSAACDLVAGSDLDNPFRLGAGWSQPARCVHRRCVHRRGRSPHADEPAQRRWS